MQIEDVYAEAGETRLLKAIVRHPGLVVPPSVYRRRHQVVGDRYGMYVAGHVQVELIHGNDLAVTAARGSALDAEGGSHRRLTDTGDRLQAEPAQALDQPDRGGCFAFA